MVETVKWVPARWLLLLALPLFSSPLWAHRLDEYLQATLVAIEPDHVRLQLYLTPGVQVIEQLLPHLDTNGDNTISTGEAVTYADSVRRDLSVWLDGRALGLECGEPEFPPVADLHSGWGIIHLTFRTTPFRLTAGDHKLKLENHHLPAISVFLINATPPGPPGIAITRQIRNDEQSAGEIAFTFVPPGRYRDLTVGIFLALALVLPLLFANTRSRRKRTSTGHSVQRSAPAIKR